MDGMEDRRAEKSRLRAEFRARRAALDEHAVAVASRSITSRILSLPEIDLALTVHVFWPFEGRNEVDTRPLIDALTARGARVALPVVASTRDEPPRLIQRLYQPGSLARGRFGVLEPVGTPEVPVASLDVAVVPALAASRDGRRLGYGGGFYDAFLAGARAVVICPVMAEFLVDTLPAEAHDCEVDVVVTEEVVVRVKDQ
jgi:5-formyltetrahydrofolate cyclo-ligase